MTGLALLTTPARADGVPQLDERRAMADSQAVVGSVPPDFTLLDRREQPLSLSQYRGKPLLVSFVYTGCFTACPVLTRSLHEAVKGLDRMLGPGQFNVVSIGFNQPIDSPLAMRAFAAQHRIGYPNWDFLSPAAEDVPALTRAHGFSYVRTPAGFDHVLGVTVIDAQGRIHAQVYGHRLTTEALGVPLRELVLAQAAAAPLGSLEDLVARVRILCTVYDADTGEYRYDWKLLLEIFGGLAFFTSVGVWFWRERRAQRQARAALRAGAG
ncbi:MAG: SCO family protein [Rubrivivax sp.]|nr:SCO family protein [Rubrivivax sp.]